MKLRILGFAALLTLVLELALAAWLHARAIATPGETTGGENLELFLALAPAAPVVATTLAAYLVTRRRRYLLALLAALLAALLGLLLLRSASPGLQWLERQMGEAYFILLFGLVIGAAPLAATLAWWLSARRQSS